MRTLNIVNRVFLHGIHYAPVATSRAPRDQQLATSKPPPKKKSKTQNDNEQWEKDAGNVSVPEIHDDDVETPQVAPEKCDVVADASEELPRPKATWDTTQDGDIASELKEIADGSVTDGEPQ